MQAHLQDVNAVNGEREDGRLPLIAVEEIEEIVLESLPVDPDPFDKAA